MFASEPKPSSTSVKRPTAHSRIAFWPLAAAAAVLMLSLGFLAGQQNSSQGASEAAIAVASTEVSKPNPSEQPPYRLRVSTVSDAGLPQTIEVPVYDEAHLKSRTSSHMHEDLSARGYAVDWETDFLTGRLQDGRQLIVPVNSPAVHYFGQ